MNVISTSPSLFANMLQNHNSLSILISFIDSNDVESLNHAINTGSLNLSTNTKNLVLSFCFTKKYLTAVDRTMTYFMYENPLTQQIDSMSVLNIARNSANQAKIIMQTFSGLFEDLSEKCMMRNEQVETVKRIVTEPDLPLPVSLRSNIGRYCSSNFQLFVCAKVTQTDNSLQQQCQFIDFKNLLQQNQQNYIKNIMTDSHAQNPILPVIRQLFNNQETFLQRVSSQELETTEGNQLFNFFVTIFKLSSNLITSIKLRLKSLETDHCAYFTEFMLRYSTYKNYVLQLEDSFGSLARNFTEIVQDALNLSFGNQNDNNSFSLWKMLMKMFSSQMVSEFQQCLPIYFDLVQRLKASEEEFTCLNENFNETNPALTISEFEDSPVLEYLLSQDSIDNLQVFLSDFAEMLVDISVDQNNVLLSGSSKQVLNNDLFEKWQHNFIQNQTEIINNFLKNNHTDHSDPKLIQYFQFLQQTLNIKPRTLKLLADQLNIDQASLNFEQQDAQIQEACRRCLGEKFSLGSSQKLQGSSITADSSTEEEEIDFEGLEYFSEVDEEQALIEIDF